MLQYNPTISGSLNITGSLIISNGMIGTVNGVDVEIFSSSISQVVTNIQTTTGSQSGRLTSIESFTSSTSARLNSIETISASNLSRINSIETITSSNIARLNSIETITASNIARLNAVETITASNIARLNAVETITSSNVARLNAVETITASNIARLTSLEITTGSLATTGSNTFIGTQTITGSLFISSDLIVQGSSSLQNITASAVSIGTNLVNLNTANPAIRYAGLSIGDSGSIGSSGSFLYDSVQDEMIFIHRGANTTVTSSVVLMGPQTFDNIGSETYPTSNIIQKGTGNEHLVDSCIFDNGTTTCVKNNLITTGTSCFGNSITAASTNGGTSAIFINSGVQNSNGIELRGGSAGTAVNWKLEKDNTVSNAFQITPSTTVGGATFSTPAFTLTSSGVACFGGQVCGNGAIFACSVASTALNMNNMASLGSISGGSIYLPYTAGLFFRSADGSTAKGKIQADNSNNLLLNSDNAGNILIGTSTDNNKGAKVQIIQNASNTNAIDFKNTDVTSGRIGTFANGLYLTQNYYYAGGQNNDCSNFGQASINIAAGTTNLSTISFALSDAGATSPSTKMVMYSSGVTCFTCQVCAPKFIATQLSATCLTLNGFSSGNGFKMDYGSASGQITAINLMANGTTNGFIGIQMVDGSNGDLWFGSSANRSMTVYRTTGHVGFGIDAPCTRVHAEGGYGSRWGGNGCFYGGGISGGGMPYGDIYGNGASYTYQTCCGNANNSSLYGGFAAGYFKGGPGQDYGGGGAGIVAIGGNGGNAESVNAGGGAGIFARGGKNGAGSLHSYAGWFDGGNVMIRCGFLGVNNTAPRTFVHIIGASCGSDIACGFGNPDTRGILHVEACSGMENSNVTVETAYGIGQFMQWTTNGMRIGHRILKGGGTGDVHMTAGQDSVKLLIYTTGNIGAPSGSNIYNASDCRLKKNIRTISYGLCDVMKLQPKIFNWKDNFTPSENGKEMLGFVAQDVQPIIPEVVEQFSDGSDITFDCETISNPLRVNEKFIIPILTKAIQEQQCMIDTLKSCLGIS